MKTIETKIKTPLLEKMAEGLLQAQQEIDELALQLSLGKSEAKEKLEEVKKEFIKGINTLKKSLQSALDQPIPLALKMKFEAVELQLQVGKVQSKESFDSQIKLLIVATIALEEEIRSLLHKMEVKGYFGHEIEKFLLKLEILRLKFGIKKFEIKEGFRSEMATVRKSIESFRKNAKKLKALPAEAYDDIKTEISSNYKSLKNAINKL
ncbi:MAG: hypothetical protein IM606_12395 [Cytophagales bacterium]|jgi:hypothetical protein|nr:hypothetical protein [Cytophagales bacterium]MCA6388824.1 hypothetical protein [Cytophagales bacterium]MCA6390709.1 hypothetical protein [Cytophagales bacterium]MCA6395979.1 hypothetical protein [Cytophagales bacterium]MCA6398212.1 hypothetical protein [Cytophagales bacterium]